MENNPNNEKVKEADWTKQLERSITDGPKNSGIYSEVIKNTWSVLNQKEIPQE